MKSWEKQGWLFRKHLEILDLATVVAFAEEVGKDEHRRASTHNIFSDGYVRAEDEFELVFRRLREQNLDRATMGYLRIRIGEQNELWHWAFDLVPNHGDGRHLHYYDYTWVELWADNLVYFVENRAAILSSGPRWSGIICDCAKQWHDFGCEHTGFLSERTMHYKDQALNRASILIGVPIGLIVIAYAIVQAVSATEK